MLTAGVAALPPEQVAAVVQALAGFDAFDSDNDPHGEHDCAVLTVAGEQVIWKIDYYDPSLTAHSTDPTDPALTIRVLTVMLDNEY